MGQHPAPVGFGRYLREAIHAAGFATPTQFARKVGTDPSVVLRWISEEQRPTIRSIERIAPVLGRTIHEMVNAAYPDSLAPTNQSLAGPHSPTAPHPPTAQSSVPSPPAAPLPAGDRGALPASAAGSTASSSAGTGAAGATAASGASGHAQPHWLAAEVDELLGPDSPLAPAEREKLQAGIERELSRYLRPVPGRRTA